MTSKHISRKRSLSSLSSCGLRSKSLITALVAVIGSLLWEMDLLAVVAFAPVHSRVSSAVVKIDNNSLWTKTAADPLSQLSRYMVRSSALLDPETSTNNIPSTAPFPCSILEEEWMLQSVHSSMSPGARLVKRKAIRHDVRPSQKLRTLSDNRIESGASNNNIGRLSINSKHRNRLVRPNPRGSRSNSPKIRISSRLVRTLPLDGVMHLEDRTKNNHRHLSREEERQLTHKVRSLRRVIRIRDSLLEEKEEWESYHPAAFQDDFPTEHQWAEACGLSVLYLRQVMMEGQESQSILVSSNIGLVTSIAKRHFYALKCASYAAGGVGTILTLQDMIQEGNLGLMTAAERFDADRGFRFSTYATYWIRQRILRSISNSSRVIRLPSYGEFTPKFPYYINFLRRRSK
jgi:hypothetical protein